MHKRFHSSNNFMSKKFNYTILFRIIFFALVFMFLHSSQLSQAESKTMFVRSPYERVQLNLYVAQSAEGDEIQLKEQSLMATAIRQAFMFGYTPTVYFQVQKPPFEFYQDKYGRPSFDDKSLTIKIALSPHMYQSEEQLITDFWNALQVNEKIQKISLELNQDYIPVLAPFKVSLGPAQAKVYLQSLMQRFSAYNPQWQTLTSKFSAPTCSGIY